MGFRDGTEYGTPTATAVFQAILVHLDEDSGGGVQARAYQTFDANGNSKDITLQARDTILGQHYGFSSSPEQDTELVLVRTKSGQIFSLVENCERPTLAKGESKMWAKEGQYLHMKESGQVDAASKSGQNFNISAQNFNAIANGFVNLGSSSPGDAAALASLVLTQLGLIVTALNAFIGVYNGHTHIDTQPNTGTNSGGVSATGATAAPPTSVASTKVRAD